MQPNEPDKDALVLGSLLNVRAIDAVLGGSQVAKQCLLSWQVKNRITVFEWRNGDGQCPESRTNSSLSASIQLHGIPEPAGVLRNGGNSRWHFFDGGSREWRRRILTLLAASCNRCPVFYEQISYHSSSVDSARSPSSYQASIALKSVQLPGWQSPC